MVWVYNGNFSEYSKTTTSIVRARIVSYGPALNHGEALYENMTVDVLEVVKGKMGHSQLVLVGDPGNLCRTYVGRMRYAIGSEHLINLFSGQYEQALAGCGEVSLKIHGDKVKGFDYYTSSEYSNNIETFLSKLDKK